MNWKMMKAVRTANTRKIWYEFMAWLTLDVRFHFFFSFTQFALNVNCWFGFYEIMWYSNSCSAYASLALTSTHTLSLLFFIRLQVEKEQHHRRHSLLCRRRRRQCPRQKRARTRAIPNNKAFARHAMNAHAVSILFANMSMYSEWCGARGIRGMAASLWYLGDVIYFQQLN